MSNVVNLRVENPPPEPEIQQDIGFDQFTTETYVAGFMLAAEAGFSKLLEALGRPLNLFGDEDYALAFKTGLKIAQNGELVDYTSIMHSLTVSKNFNNSDLEFFSQKFSEAADFPCLEANLPYYVKILLERYKQRTTQRILNKGLTRPVSQLNPILEELGKVITLETGVKSDQVVSELIPGLYEILERKEENPNFFEGVKTGFPEIDNICQGFSNSDLSIIAARPGMGKTAFILNVASHIARDEGKKVLFISLEMTKARLFQRLVSSLSGVPSWKMEKGKMNEADWGKIAKACNGLDNFNLIINDQSDLLVSDIRRKVEALQPECLIIDYLQLLQPVDSKQPAKDRVSEISLGLKRIAKDFNIPVIALSQLSRQCETRTDKRPLSADLRESGQIEQDAGLILMLYRHEFYDPEDVEARGIAEVLIRKSRHTQTGEVKLGFAGDKMLFTSLLCPAVGTKNNGGI